MKVLLLDPTSPHSFWTFDRTVKGGGKKALLPSLGLITVAALLPKDWEVRYVDTRFQPMGEQTWEWPDLIMISGMIIQKEGMLRLIQEAKQRGKSVAVGGPYVTSLPEEVMAAGADFVIKGEAETALPAFLDALERGETSGVFEEPRKPDLTESPIPRFDLLDMDSYLVMGVQTSRGCPFDCEFCDIVNLYGRYPRYKSADQVIAELDYIFSLGWRGDVFVSDDNFIGSRKHALAILDKLIPWIEGHGYPYGFWTQVSVNLGQDLEMIDLMTAANFGYVFVGIESPDEEVLALTRKFQNIRNPLADSIHSINANGLSIVGSFVIGFDNEKKGMDDRICEFVDQTHIPIVMLNNLQAAPNTALWKRLKRENRLLKNKTHGGLMEGRMNFVPSRPEAEILGEYFNIIDRLYEPRAYLKRAHEYYMTMRPTRRALARRDGIEPPKKTDVDNRPSVPFWLVVLHVLRIAWKHWIRPRYRRKAFREFLEICIKNPSRMRAYINCLALGENLFSIRDDFRRNGQP